MPINCYDYNEVNISFGKSLSDWKGVVFKDENIPFSKSKDLVLGNIFYTCLYEGIFNKRLDIQHDRELSMFSTIILKECLMHYTYSALGIIIAINSTFLHNISEDKCNFIHLYVEKIFGTKVFIDFVDVNTLVIRLEKTFFGQVLTIKDLIKMYYQYETLCLNFEDDIRRWNYE